MQPLEVAAPQVLVQPPGRFSIGNVLSRSFRVWASNVPFFLGVALLLRVPGFLVSVLAIDQGGLVPVSERLSAVLDTILGYVGTGLVTTSVLDQLCGRARDARRSLSFGASRLGPLIGTAIGTSFLTGLLFLLLIFPGVMAVTRWILVAPVVVAEPDAVPRRRSSDLTVGHRGEVLGLLLLVYGGLVITAVTTGVLLGERSPWTSNGIWLVLSALFLSFQSVLEPVLYEQLRTEKEGADVGQLAAVFE